MGLQPQLRDVKIVSIMRVSIMGLNHPHYTRTFMFVCVF